MRADAVEPGNLKWRLVAAAPRFLDTRQQRGPSGRVGQVVSSHVATEIDPLPRRRGSYPLVNVLLVPIVSDVHSLQRPPRRGLRLGEILESLLESPSWALSFLDQGEALGERVEAAGDVVEDRDLDRTRRRL